MGALLVTLLFFMTSIGKKINEPFQVSKEKERPEVLLDLPLQTVVKAQDLNYGDLVKYEYRTPMASYAQVTNKNGVVLKMVVPYFHPLMVLCIVPYKLQPITDSG
jgi:hypothetical protein